MERPEQSHIAGIIIAYFLIYVVWGSTYFFIGVALKDLPPFLLGALRFTAAGLILLGICHFRGEKIFKRSLIKTFGRQWHCTVIYRYGSSNAGTTLSDE